MTTQSGSRVRPSERVYADSLWLMGPDGEYLQRYRSEQDARRAVTDFNRTGRALSPAEYARGRRRA